MTARHEGEVRAARNRALFRAVNERIREINKAFASITDTYDIACECADLHCVETLSITPRDYDVVRAHPDQFLVLPSHINPDLERTVRRCDSYAVIENRAPASASPNQARSGSARTFSTAAWAQE